MNACMLLHGSTAIIISEQIGIIMCTCTSLIIIKPNPLLHYNKNIIIETCCMHKYGTLANSTNSNAIKSIISIYADNCSILYILYYIQQ